jgi:hypothetical protein
MKTTQMYVEQVILGLLLLLAIWLFIMPIFFVDRLLMLDWSGKDSFGLAESTLVVMVAYLCGLVYDRVADTILDETDRHHRLRFALKDTARKTKGGIVPRIKKDPFPETCLRIKAMKNSEAAEDMDYLRSRMRLMRGLCTLIPLYTVIASLYLATDWELPGSNRPLWIGVGVSMLLAYMLVLFLDVITRPALWQPPPKTYELDEVYQYARSHIDGGGAGHDKAALVWRAADCYRDPAWYGFAFAIAASIFILAITGNLACYWPVPLAGVLFTLLAGWVWLRVSKTFMLFLVSFAEYGG